MEHLFAQWMHEQLPQYIHQYGGIVIFLFLMVGIVGIPLPDEIMMTFVGTLVHKGELAFVPTLLWAFAGSCCGISLSYGLGWGLGPPVVHRFGRFLRLTDEKMARVHAWYDRVGKWALTFGYFVPGFRHLTALVAGASKVQYGEFAVFAYGGAALWVTAFVTLGYFLGDAWENAREDVRAAIARGSIAAGVLLAAFIVISYLRQRRKAGAATSGNSKNGD